MTASRTEKISSLSTSWTLRKFMNFDLALKLLPIARALRAYHRHEVVGLDKIPTTGPVIVATSHSLATYDISLLMAAVFDHCRRFPRSLIDHTFYKFPYLGELMERAGCVVGTQENARTLIEQGEMIYIAPGGMKESLRPSTDKYRIIWDTRKGFARLSLETGSPIVLAACPRADDLYEVYPNPVTKWVYKNFHLPLAFARGIGVTPLPKPIKLYHALSEPIFPPKALQDPAARKRQLNRYHAKLAKRMQELMDEALELG